VPDFLAGGFPAPQPAPRPGPTPGGGTRRGRAKAEQTGRVGPAGARTDPGPSTLAAFVAAELAALPGPGGTATSGGTATPGDSAGLVALAGRIRAALARWRSAGESEAACSALETLADQLAAASTDAAAAGRLWEHARATLEAIRDGRAEQLTGRQLTSDQPAPSDQPASGMPGRRSRTAFWKR
jgi:Ca-activated chloride channel family protein